jgi:hypothetical protein
MNYLLPSEYEAFGLCADTAAAWVKAASAMVDAHCRRTSLAETSYTERFRMGRGSQSVRVSYAPLISVQAVKAKYGRGCDEQSCEFEREVATAFGFAGAWIDVDVSTLQVDASVGELRLAESLLGPRYSEVEVTYTAGLAVIPDAVKVACAQIVKNAQATPALNVKTNKMESLQMQYFSDSLIDTQVRALLRPYVAERLG